MLQYTGKADVVRYGAATKAPYLAAPGGCLLVDIRDGMAWLSPKFGRPFFRVVDYGGARKTDKA